MTANMPPATLGLALAMLMHAFALSTATLAADAPRRVAQDFATLAAPAQPSGGFYASGRQFFGKVDDTRFSTASGNTGFRSEYEFARLSGGAIGYAFAPIGGVVSPRVEFEGSFGALSVDKHNVSGATSFAGGTADSFGDLRSYTGLANAYLDLNAGRGLGLPAGHFATRLTPFISAGIGATNATLRRQGVSNTGVVMDASDTKLTWQVSAGIGILIFDRTTFDIGFRHQRTEGLSFTARDGTASKTDLISNVLTMGIRRTF